MIATLSPFVALAMTAVVLALGIWIFLVMTLMGWIDNLIDWLSGGDDQ